MLVFHTGALGDLVLAAPVALALTRLYPTSRVRWVGPRQKGELMSRLAGVEPVDVEGGFSALHAEGATVAPAVERLLAQSHRVVSFVAEPGDVWSRRVATLAPSATLTWLRLRPPADWQDPVSGSRHAADHLVWQCGRAEQGGDVSLGEAARQMRAHMESAGVLPRRAVSPEAPVLLHPGSGSAAKCWPLDRYRELALLLRDRLGRPIVWCVGEVERERWRRDEWEAMAALGEVVACDTLTGLLEQLRGAAVVVGNDSGPGHLAAAAGVPVVSVFGPTDPAVWKPLGPRVKVVVAPEGDLRRLGVGPVLDAVVRMPERERLPSDTRDEPDED
ncbi:MAG: glycosyltransferase family 9 protein [Tepidisphaerales bacterium]